MFDKEFEVKGTINFLITSVIRERPFILRGGGGGYVFFLKKIF
jgi:hypothetical protein